MLHRPGKPRRKDPGPALRLLRQGRGAEMVQDPIPPIALVQSGRAFGLFVAPGIVWVHVPVLPKITDGRSTVPCDCQDAVVSVSGSPLVDATLRQMRLVPVRMRTFQYNHGGATWKVSLGQCERCQTIYWGGLRSF